MVLHVICSEGLELWVIHKILYAEKGSLTSGDSRHGSAGANTNVLVPAGGPSLGANAEFDASRVILDEFAVRDNEVRHFAFKAIHASYDFSDNSVQIQPDAVGGTPITWGEDEEDCDQQLHLGGLFLKPPLEKQNDNGEDLECLEIVVMNPDDEKD
jgi:hypothetical protein